jgi:hypothetical protein
MSTIEKLANDKSLKDLFADYLTCKLYLDQIRGGLRSASKSVQLSLSKRFDQVKATMVKAVKKHYYLRKVPEKAVDEAAQYVLRQHPVGTAYFLSRLPLR